MSMTVSELQVKVSADTKDAETGLASLGSKVASAGGTIATAFGTVAVGGVLALGAALAGSVASASTFEAAMSGIKAVSGASAGEMELLTSKALDLGAATSFSATEAADGISELVKAGVSIGDVLGGGAAAALNLAAAGGLSVAESASIASNAMNVFGISGSNAGHVADVIAGAANASAIDVHDFGMSLAAAGSVANTVGIGFEDLATATAVMGQAGIKSSDAGTSLKTMLLNLTPASKAQLAVSKELGITTADGANKFFDATGKAKSLSEIAGVLQTATAGLTEQQKLQALQTLFGTDAIRAAAIMAKAGSEGFNEMATSIGKVTAEAVAAERLNNLKGDVEQLTGSIETAGILIGMAFTPALRGITQGATDLVNTAGPIIADFAEQSSMGIRTAAKEIADAWGTVKQALAGDWAPSDELSPFINAVGNAGIALGKMRDFIGEVIAKTSAIGGFAPFVSAVDHLGTVAATVWQDVGKLADSIDRVGGAAGTHEQKVSSFAMAIKTIGTGIDLAVLNAGLLIDSTITMGRVAADAAGLWIGFGKAIVGAVTGNKDLFDEAARDIGTNLGDMIAAGLEWKTKTSTTFQEGMADVKNLVGSGSLEAAAAHKTAVASMVTAEEESMGSMSVAAHTGMSEVVNAVESQAPAAVTAAQEMGVGMTAAITDAAPQMTAAADGAATGVVSAVEAQTPAATAAATAMGDGMASGIEAAGPTMATAAEGAASGAVAAVQGQEGAASGAGQSLGAALGSGLEGGILAYVGRIASAAAQLVSSALGAAREEADSHSPSKKTEQLGQDMAEGLEIGLNKSGLGDEMQRKIRDFIADTRAYIPVAGQIAGVENEIKTIRDKGQTDYLFRAQEMITIDSEALRLKSDLVSKERDQLHGRQDLAAASREVSDIERGSLTDRTALIEMDGKRKQLRLDEINLEQQLVGLDSQSKKAKTIQEQIDKLRDQDHLLGLEADRITTTNSLAANAAKVRKEGLDDQVRGYEGVDTAIKNEIDRLGAEQGAFTANEAIIKNATDNEVGYRQRLIAVFTAEGKPLADRISAGQALVEQLHNEGKISDDLYNAVKKVADKMGDAKGAAAGFGSAAATADPQLASATKKADEMAAAAQKVADSTRDAGKQVDALSGSLGKLPDWFHPGKGGGSLFQSGAASTTNGMSGGSTNGALMLPAVPMGGGDGGVTYVTIDARGAQVYDGSKFEDLVVGALDKAGRGGRIVRVTR